VSNSKRGGEGNVLRMKERLSLGELQKSPLLVEPANAAWHNPVET
jgi:hypothetical protein